MAAFQFFVHRTHAIVKDINSCPMNLPEGGFYNMKYAEIFCKAIEKEPGLISIYDKNGKLVKIFKTC